MKDKLLSMHEKLKRDLLEIKTAADLDGVRIKYLGKKGELTAILRQMGNLSPTERPIMGKLANDVRAALEVQLEEQKEKLSEFLIAQRLKSEQIDITMAGKVKPLGKKSPLAQVLDELYDVFLGMGFSIETGPEIEYVYYNFDALNIPKDHPSRDIADTFYITDKILLRTQTSPVQIRVMETQEPPIKIIAPGRVYRPDAVDATHSPIFHQIEGLVIGQNVTMADLKGTLETFAKALYGDDTIIRFRPHNFPFTEPSAEVDIRCFACAGKGCPLCKGEGWIEILGSGMVHPNVLKNCGLDPEKYSGFAFGIGLERIVMKKFNINDLRMFYENDLRFLRQF